MGKLIFVLIVFSQLLCLARNGNTGQKSRETQVAIIRANAISAACPLSSVAITVTGSEQQGPYGGTARNIPGAIQVEDFDWIQFSRTSLVEVPSSAEKVVFDKTIDWQWKFPLWYGGNSFYWWHHPAGSVTDYGNMPADDWTTPYDYENGTYYLRFEVLEQPTDNAFTIQFGIWQDEHKAGGWSECVSKPAKLSGGAGSLCAVNVGSPATWWQKRPDVKVDFTRPEDFYRIGMVLWKNGSCIPMAQGWNSRAACNDAETEAAKFFPMRARVTVVAVASGHTFSGWDKYLNAGR
ncbi:MAG TPA: hypothetical protein DD458_22920 [Prolixibacteraceae bacterium]|nr:MAG: hypothetical protein A2W89_00655 [Bacteroidetes bacterium GWE2_42_39]HBL78093.1 hypothetical protein [Prolixibacteraceae bacterium]HCR90382.1 hypothetical protein [Prolixibacteraceae bacterium]